MFGAVEVVVTVSPTEGVVGRPVEVLVRTFAPIGTDDLSLPAPSLAYPAPSGLWNVLYPIADYPFDVVAKAPTGATQQVALTRDPADASLWRGSFTPTSSGEWTIVLRNFPTSDPTRVAVIEQDAPTASWFGLFAVLASLLVGVILGRVLPRSRASAGE